MTRNFVPCLIVMLMAVIVMPSLSAQCCGSGNEVIQIQSDNVYGLAANANVTFSLFGTPKTAYVILFDSDPGPYLFPTLGPLGLGLSPNMFSLAGLFSPGGMSQLKLKLPKVIQGSVFCAQFFSYVPSAPLGLAMSNGFCFCTPCVLGCKKPITELGHMTKIPYTGTFPVNVLSVVRDKSATGTHLGQAKVSFDPANPPKFDRFNPNPVVIEKIAYVNNELFVFTRMSPMLFGKDTPGGGNLGDITYLKVSAGNIVKSIRLNTSCTKPLGVAAVIGGFTITRLLSPMVQCGKCTKPLNEIGYRTIFKYKGPFPVKITTLVRADRATNPLEGKAQVTYNPANPPTFPITVNGSVSIRNIAYVDNQLLVETMTVGKKLREGKYKANTYVEVKVGSLMHSEKIHTSCSKPLGVGSVIGDFIIHHMIAGN